MNDLAKNVILWIVIAVVLLTVFQSFGPSNQRIPTVPYSTFLTNVEAGSVEEVVFDGDAIRGKRSSESFLTYNPETDNTLLISTLEEHDVDRFRDGAETAVVPAAAVHFVVPDPAV